jgi:2-phospho-L-lactate guanylyltransferase
LRGAEEMGLVAVVPVKDLRGTKSRLSPILDPCGRAGLTLYMMGRVVSRLREAGVGRVYVVSPDRLVLRMAAESGATPLRQESRGLNPALEEGRRRAIREGASALLVLPADLPLVEAEDLRAFLDAAGERGEGPLALISPDATRDGTNALLLRPPDAIPFAFGPGSFDEHVRAARRRGLRVEVCERPHLAFDLDTKEDFSSLDPARPGGLH